MTVGLKSSLAEFCGGHQEQIVGSRHSNLFPSVLPRLLDFCHYPTVTRWVPHVEQELLTSSGTHGLPSFFDVVSVGHL